MRRFKERIGPRPSRCPGDGAETGDSGEAENGDFSTSEAFEKSWFRRGDLTIQKGEAMWD